MSEHRAAASFPGRTRAGVEIRPMQPAEEPLVRRTLPLFMRLSRLPIRHALVAVQEGRLVGAQVLKTFRLPKGRKGGFSVWLYAAPDSRDRGLGVRLGDTGLEYLLSQGCDEILTCIHGYNTPPGRIAGARQFAIMPPGEQFRRYGLRALLVWAKTLHLADMGTFLWARPVDWRPARPAWQWCGGMLANAVVALVALWSRVGWGAIDPRSILALPALVVLVLGARHAAMRLAARAQGLSLEYRAWESGFPLSLVVAALAGRWLAIPGGLYPAGDRWRYRDELPKLARMAVAGILVELLLAAAAGAALRCDGLSPSTAFALHALQSVVRPLVFVDTVLPFFPFSSFNGRRIWDYHRWLWMILAAAAVAVLFL